MEGNKYRKCLKCKGSFIFLRCTFYQSHEAKKNICSYDEQMFFELGYIKLSWEMIPALNFEWDKTFLALNFRWG